MTLASGMKKIIGDIVNDLEGRKWNRPLICFPEGLIAYWPVSLAQ
jgi:hypothetical protein